MKLKIILLIFALINNFNASIFAAQNNDIENDKENIGMSIFDDLESINDAHDSDDDIFDELESINDADDLPDFDGSYFAQRSFSDENDKQSGEINDGHLSAASSIQSSAQLTSAQHKADNDEQSRSMVPAILQGNINGTGTAASSLSVQTRNVATVIAKKKTGVKRKAQSISKANSKVDAKKSKKKERKCNFCNYTTTHQSTLERHERTHTLKKPYECEECGKSYARSDTLNNHKRIHLNVKLHKCNYKDCNRTFCDLSNLNQHQLVHTGEKSFVCKECGTSFSKESNLKSHAVTHTVRSYVCDHEGCGRLLSSNSSLKRHQKTHIRETHVCDYKGCKAEYSDKSSLNRHKKIKHGKGK